MEVEFEDTFDGGQLDLDRWIPHWSSRERSAARYEVGGGSPRLLIEAEEPWCPELDGEVRVSSLQTGVFAGPVGSVKTVDQAPDYPMQLIAHTARVRQTPIRRHSSWTS